MSQLLLFPDPRPLVERLGLEFFRRVPQSPGVYLMRDASETVLYVGKAKNLRKRLNHYRVANPDRMKHRQLKLLRQVVDIQLEECADEADALAREASLLLRLRPRFNRAGTWPRQPRLIAWKITDGGIAFQLLKETPLNAQFYGRVRSGGASIMMAMARLTWCALHSRAGYSRMPQGFWKIPAHSSLLVPKLCAEVELLDETSLQLQTACNARVADFTVWFEKRASELVHPFELAARALDLELLNLTFNNPNYRAVPASRSRNPLSIIAPQRSHKVFP